MMLRFILLFFLLSFSSHLFAQRVQQDFNFKEEKRQSELLIPNAFSPNNDGRNDKFEIYNFGQQILREFKVFNRWGTVVFKTDNPREGWDGTFKNVMQPTGVYGYIIVIYYPDTGKEETYKGTVTLIR